ncbi:MAG: kelch repeat-containing protein, partial [Thermoanaerobaculia bacterium]|nr:kelch repeat-containing protein [Thermoanaerobaculia bacterium]
MRMLSDTSRVLIVSLIGLAFLIISVDVTAFPSTRRDPAMVWSGEANGIILFGGQSLADAAGNRYQYGDTWKFTGLRWVRLYPENAPSPRFGMSMVYDSNRDRILLFGGGAGEASLADTWVYEDENWTELDTPNAPTNRRSAGMAFDPVRDRVVLFGGLGVDDESIFDTWEFDGTTWIATQTAGGPQVPNPSLAY